MQIQGIDHIELVVTDVDRFVKFFQAMGFELVRRTEHHGGSAELRVPGENQPIIELHRVGGEENPGLNHIALRVSDVRQAYEELRSQGIGCSEPHYVEATGRTIVNLRDPDGWRLQLVDTGGS